MNSRGALVGCLLSLLCYVFLSAVFSSLHMLVYLPDSYNQYPDPISHRSGQVGKPEDVLKFHSNISASKSLARRKTLLSIVPISWAALKFVLENQEELKWKRQYWQDKLVVLGRSDDYFQLNKANKTLNVHLARECHDFSLSSSSWWTPSQLVCLLENMYIHFSPQYDWFALLSRHTYLSTQQLKRILKGMDPWSIMYMGHPNPGGHCSGGTAVVLSREALKQIVMYLRHCLNHTLGGDTSLGDIFLGRCFMNIVETSCYEFDEAEKYFIDKRKTIFNMEDLMKSSSLFTSVYPVYSEIEMKTLYQMDLIRELRFNLAKAKELQDNLYSSPICKPNNYVPKSKPSLRTNDMLHWSSFDPPVTFTNGIQPSVWFKGDLRVEIETIARKALKQYCSKHNVSLTFVKVSYGMHRYLGIRGKEYMIDVVTEEKTPVRLHLLRYHNLNPIVLEYSSNEFLQKIVDFIVPLSNVRARFKDFMETYEHVCLQANEQCRLHLVVYGENDVKAIKKSIEKYQQKYPSAIINVIPTYGTFSRGRALHIGISTLQAKDLLFTCDVDMTLERSFLNRCRQNAIQGQRIYYPEVFKYYNMDYVYKFESKPRFTYDINRYHGHWCTYGYGMVCMYKSDYVRIGGYDLNITGWGGEDVKLADRALKNGYDIMRAPDPALSHRYHPKVCPKYLSNVQYTQCIASRNEDIADKRRLADYVHYLENHCNVKKSSRK